MPPFQSSKYLDQMIFTLVSTLQVKGKWIASCVLCCYEAMLLRWPWPLANLRWKLQKNLQGINTLWRLPQPHGQIWAITSCIQWLACCRFWYFDSTPSLICIIALALQLHLRDSRFPFIIHDNYIDSNEILNKYFVSHYGCRIYQLNLCNESQSSLLNIILQKPANCPVLKA